MKNKIIPALLLTVSLVTLCLMGGCLSDDRDGDGLPNSIEKDGWPILVLLLGETNKTEIYVTSDPDRYDTDKDGLSDWEEYFSYHTNPQEKDTDQDTLTDWEEINIHGTDPNGAFHDLDKDGFWDASEVLYFRDLGFNDTTIRFFLNESDIDGDGTLDGLDKDPLRDLGITLHLQFITITQDDDDNSPQVWEIYFGINGNETGIIFSETITVPVGVTHSLNMTYDLNLSDDGEPGRTMCLLQVMVWDSDISQEIPDPVRINNDSGYWGTDELNIDLHMGPYILEGLDGILYFAIEDARVSSPWVLSA